jgi:hypothetical protein
MECHRCEHRAAVEAGKYARMPFRQTPCAQCELRESSLLTMQVEVDRPVYVPGLGEKGADKMVPFTEELETVEGKLPVGLMAELVNRLLALPEGVRDVVCWRFTGVPYPEIARRQGLTTAGAEMRHKRALRMFPELRHLFARKMAKQKTRRRPAVRVSGTVPV